MSSTFQIEVDRNGLIKDAIRRKYLIPRKDGTILRANKASVDGVIDAAKGYHVIQVQTHKASGRVYFNLRWRGVQKSVLVNRVIAIAFLPNPLNLPQVNHIDGDKQHNYLEQPTDELRAKWGPFQLEWSSGSDNEKHAHRTGLKSGRGSANSGAKLSADQVLEIRASDEPMTALALRYGVSRSTIAAIKTRKTWSHL